MRVTALGPAAFARIAALTAIGVLGAWISAADAAPTLRFQTDLRGDALLFGNTLGFDCRTAVPDPIVGSVNRSACFDQINQQMFIDDTSADVFFRADDSGQVSALASYKMSDARSAAVLQLPTGATVAYARIYWSSTVREDTSPTSSILIDRPGTGGFSRSYMAQPSDIQAAASSFQATADITDLVQQAGAGVYRVSGFPKNQLVDRFDDNNYAAWSILVIYKLDSEPVRNFAVYDGLTSISAGNNTSVMVRGFVVPSGGGSNSRIGIIGYEGDEDQSGDSVLFNGARLTDGESGSDTNFFNSSRTYLGQAVSVSGDLPQMNGHLASMQGLDLDIVNVTPMLTPGDTQAQVDLVTGTVIGADSYFIGALYTAITSHKPIIETTLTVPPSTSPLPGDVVDYTLTARNVGDDGASDVIVEHVLPQGLIYVPGSLRIVSGPNSGAKTDQVSDDQAEYDSFTRTLRIRIGTGASASKGGNIAPGEEATTIKYQLQVADTAFGVISTQAIAHATPASQLAAGSTNYPSGNGMYLNQPTSITVRECSTNYDCTVLAPVCDTRSNPHRCTASCTTDADCQGAPGGKDVCGGGQICVECSSSQIAACAANGEGSACLASGACGCTSNADCGGRTCDVATNSCPKPIADLAPVISSDPDPADVDHPVNIHIHVSNQGPAAAPSGTQIQVDVSSGGTLQSVQSNSGWRCIQTDNSVRCIFNRPIAVGGNNPDLILVVSPATADSSGASASTLSIKATVSSDVSTDPNPGDNQVIKSIELGRYRIAGGGIGCALARDGHAGLSAQVAALALLLWLTRRRRRFSPNFELGGPSASRKWL